MSRRTRPSVGVHETSNCVAVRDRAGAVRVVGAGAASVWPWSGAAGADAVHKHHSDTGATSEGRFDPGVLSRTDAVLDGREAAPPRHPGGRSGAVPPPSGGQSPGGGPRPA